MSEDGISYDSDIIPPMRDLPNCVMSPQQALERVTTEARRFSDAALTMYTLINYRAESSEREVASLQSQVSYLIGVVDNLKAKIEQLEAEKCKT